MKNFCIQNKESSLINTDDRTRVLSKLNYINSSAVQVENNFVNNTAKQTLKSKSESRQLSPAYESVDFLNHKSYNTRKTILNDHDIKHAMLQASQVNLKNSLINGNNKSQLVNLNFFSSDGKVDQRKNLEKISLQYVLSKGTECLDFFYCFTICLIKFSLL
jgi:hypothetical protein